MASHVDRDLSPIMTRSHPADTCCQGTGQGEPDTKVCTSQVSPGMTHYGFQFILNPECSVALTRKFVNTLNLVVESRWHLISSVQLVLVVGPLGIA